MKRLLYYIALLLERAPHWRLRTLGSDLYYVARYGRGRYARGAWTVHGWPRLVLFSAAEPTVVYQRGRGYDCV
jgi:hypothetical protein